MTRLNPQLWMCMSSVPDVVSALGFINEESEEDEWTALEHRFEQEGLNFNLPTEQKLLHVWRWLSDAEYNLRTSRKMLDKQRTQQTQEFKEVEIFVEKLKDITDERVRKVEMEKERLEHEVESLRKVGNSETNLNEVASMLRQEGLNHILHCSLSEQVAYLLVERARLMEEIINGKEKRKGLSANLTDNVKLSYPQVHEIMEQQKTDYEEKLRQHQESATRIKEEMKISYEDQLCHIRKELQETRKMMELLSSKNPNVHKDSLQAKCKELDSKVLELSERSKKMEKAMRQLENENETLIYKLSEALTELDEKETQIRSLRMKLASSLRRPSKVLSGENLLRTESSPIKHSTDKLAAKDDVIKKLHTDLEKSQEQLLIAGQKYENLAVKYERRKLKEKAHIQREREKHNKQLSSLKENLRELQEEVLIAQVNLNTERTHRDKILEKMTQLTEENKQLSDRLVETEEIVNEKAHSLSLLNVRVSYLEKEKQQWIDKRTLNDSTFIESKTSSEPAAHDALMDQLNSPTRILQRQEKTGRPPLLRWFSQPETGIHQSQKPLTFGARLDSLINNIDQLRNIVVGSATNLMSKEN